MRARRTVQYLLAFGIAAGLHLLNEIMHIVCVADEDEPIIFFHIIYRHRTQYTRHPLF